MNYYYYYYYYLHIWRQGEVTISIVQRISGELAKCVRSVHNIYTYLGIFCIVIRFIEWRDSLMIYISYSAVNTEV